MHYTIGDWAYLNLQFYRKSSLFHKAHKKMAIKFFGPYQILEKIGTMAYKLDLPCGFEIHLNFTSTENSSLLGSSCYGELKSKRLEMLVF